MAQVKKYRAKKEFKLDCGHTVKAGEMFAVTKTFTCEQDAKRLSVFQSLTANSVRSELK